ncbi:hypothetical protein ABK040_001266 [Willaertia magna]
MFQLPTGLTNLNLRITLSPFPKNSRTYIYDIKFSEPAGRTKFSFTNSSKDIFIYQIQAPEIVPYRSLSGHSDQISGLSFSKTNENILMSCSQDCTVRLWDLRLPNPNVHTQTFGQPLSCVDLSSGYLYGFASGETYAPNSIAVGDIRQNNPLSQYLLMEEIHTDAINQIEFTESNHKLYSCSDDGLIHIYDISESNQKESYEELEDSLEGVLNVEDGVVRFGFLGTTNCLYAITQTNHLHFWLYDSQEDEYSDYRVLKKEEEWSTNICQSNQLIDINASENLHFMEVTGSVGDDSAMLHTSATGTVYLFKLTNQLMNEQCVATMSGGHAKDSLIRTVKVLGPSTLMSAGEDGNICVWTTD